MTHLVYGVSMPISEQNELKFALKTMCFIFRGLIDFFCLECQDKFNRSLLKILLNFIMVNHNKILGKGCGIY